MMVIRAYQMVSLDIGVSLIKEKKEQYYLAALLKSHTDQLLCGTLDRVETGPIACPLMPLGLSLTFSTGTPFSVTAITCFVLVVVCVVMGNEGCHAYGLSAGDLGMQHRSLGEKSRPDTPWWKSVKDVKQPPLSRTTIRGW